VEVLLILIPNINDYDNKHRFIKRSVGNGLLNRNPRNASLPFSERYSNCCLDIGIFIKAGPRS
jgi:hypothetical protein